MKRVILILLAILVTAWQGTNHCPQRYTDHPGPGNWGSDSGSETVNKSWVPAWSHLAHETKLDISNRHRMHRMQATIENRVGQAPTRSSRPLLTWDVLLSILCPASSQIFSDYGALSCSSTRMPLSLANISSQAKTPLLQCNPRLCSLIPSLHEKGPCCEGAWGQTDTWHIL